MIDCQSRGIRSVPRCHLATGWAAGTASEPILVPLTRAPGLISVSVSCNDNLGNSTRSLHDPLAKHGLLARASWPLACARPGPREGPGARSVAGGRRGRSLRCSETRRLAADAKGLGLNTCADGEQAAAGEGVQHWLPPAKKCGDPGRSATGDAARRERRRGCHVAGDRPSGLKVVLCVEIGG